MNPTWGWSQMVVAYSLLEASLWTEGPTQRIFALAAAVWIVLATLVNRRSLRQLGLGTRGFVNSLIAIPVALAAAALIVLICWEVGTLRGLVGTRPPLWHSGAYASWALMQQFILNSSLAVTVPDAWLRHMRVGISYLHFLVR